MRDLLLNKANGYWDINIIDGDFEQTGGFETAVYISLLCERRASPSEVARIEMRRGWWGNLIWNDSGLEMGSKIWLLSQTRFDSLLTNRVKNYVEEALFWMIDDGYASNINVEVTAITSRSIFIKVDITTSNNELITSTFEVSR
jgi:phage gp46-like protein